MFSFYIISFTRENGYVYELYKFSVLRFSCTYIYKGLTIRIFSTVYFKLR